MSICRMARIDVGPPSSAFKPWNSIEVDFHQFADLPVARGESVEAPVFECLGRRWGLDVYPGGDHAAGDGMVTIYLFSMSLESIEIDWFWSIQNSSGQDAFPVEKIGTHCFASFGKENCTRRQDVKRSKILGALVNGTLTIEVKMRESSAQSKCSPGAFIPENPLSKNILRKFMDDESADVTFEVDGGSEQGGNTHKKSKISKVFCAHRLILQDGAPVLADLCKPGEGGGATSVAMEIADVKADIFRLVLYYVYGGKISDVELEANAMELIDAADKFGVVNLKLEAEACYVENTKFTIENILENLIYAESKNCAHLKEAVMDFILENGDDVMGKLSFDDVPGSVVMDLLAAVARGKKKRDIDASNDYNAMRVGTLRKMLHEKGLEVDGSRETMIALLKENS